MIPPIEGASLSVVAIPAGLPPGVIGTGGGHRGSPSSSTKIHKECTHDAQSPVCRVHVDPGSPCRPRSCSRRGLPASAPGRAAGPGRRRGRRRDRRAALRAHPASHQPPQRHEAQDRGHHRRRGRARHPQASHRLVLPVPAPPAPAGGQGPVRRDLLRLDRGGLHPQGRRPRQGPGQRVGDLQVHGLADLQGHRRGRARVPVPPPGPHLVPLPVRRAPRTWT